MKRLIFLCCAILFLTQLKCEKILIVYNMPSYSHCSLGEAFAKGLSAKGHNVTLITPFTLNKKYPNVTHIVIDGMIDKMKRFEHRPVLNGGFLGKYFQYIDMMKTTTIAALESKAIQNILKSNETYDLVMLDAIFNKALYGIANHVNASLIVTSSSLSNLVNSINGNPAPFSFVPMLMTSSTDRMDFFQRFMNTFTGLAEMFLINWMVLPLQENIYKDYFKNGPDFQDVIKNVDLIFTNTHPIIESPRPYLPDMIPIGGFHLEEPKNLSLEIEEFLNNTSEGFIYVSLGTNIKSANLSDSISEAFLEAFSKLPQKVLWKWENDNIKNVPKNVLIKKWFPQQDILAHEKIRLFISHGGLLSLIESTFNTVPLIIIPFFYDQYKNAMTVVSSNCGLQVLPSEISDEIMLSTIQEILSNPKYRVEMTNRAAIINDQPLKPNKTAIFWIEYILRHKSQRHLQSSVKDLNLFQYLLLDVIAFCGSIIILAIIGLYFCIKFCCCRRKVNRKRKTKKTQ